MNKITLTMKNMSAHLIMSSLSLVTLKYAIDVTM